MYDFRDARRGEIAQIGTVPRTTMRGLFEDGRPIIGTGKGPKAAKLVCVKGGATLFIERIKFMLSSKMHNSEFANAENIECSFHTNNAEFAVGDGFVMRNGVLIPLTDILDGTRVRCGLAFA